MLPGFIAVFFTLNIMLIPIKFGKFVAVLLLSPPLCYYGAYAIINSLTEWFAYCFSKTKEKKKYLCTKYTVFNVYPHNVPYSMLFISSYKSE